ncbi:hypothetical protein TRFO_35158 [Tritrichomonas foetus]|uniref:Uncharacterized protein n=1 Tax=Tritrichomonas foetus TaxID=1144522 RepID=A0A1J4JJD4_9EUKA|nr:hypothetical protein TRFO_35158 [Tritrichomonas foetus]|eukprot:OHS98447.1 hypothetical protein TRFO_35158 [Tritrichomonas foetus]
MISFVPASSLEKRTTDSLESRQIASNDTANLDQSRTFRKDAYYFHPKEMLISHIKCYKDASLWKEIHRLPDNSHKAVLKISTIDEIYITANHYIISSDSGLCAAYRKNFEFDGYINERNGELVKSAYYNSIDDEVIKVSILSNDDYSELRCFKISKNDVSKSSPVFDQYQLKYPGFIEFDAVNNLALVLEGRTKKYHIISLSNYKKFFTIEGSDILDVKMTPDVVIALRRCLEDRVKFELYRLDGTIEKIEMFIKPKHPIEFFDCLGISFILKQSRCNMKIYNIGTHQCKEISGTANIPSSHFSFLYTAKKIAIFRKATFYFFTFQGDFLFTMQNKREIQNCPLAVSKNQKFMICVSIVGFDYFIAVFSLDDGRCLVQKKIPPSKNNGYKISSIAFDETSNVLITGDQGGKVSFYI